MRRHLIFVLVLAVLGSLLVIHLKAGETLEANIDMALIAFALYSWKPWHRFRR